MKINVRLENNFIIKVEFLESSELDIWTYNIPPHFLQLSTDGLFQKQNLLLVNLIMDLNQSFYVGYY